MLHERRHCPYCPPHKTPTLSVDLMSGWFNCFRCGYKGRLKPGEFIGEFLLRESNRNVPLEWPMEYVYLGLPPKTLRQKVALRYLKARGVTPEQIVKFRIGFCEVGQYADRIIVPVFEGREIVFFVARSINPKTPRKYLNPKKSKSGTVFKTFLGKAPRAVVVEGVFDAIRVSEVLPAIALLSKKATGGQLQTLRESADELIIMLDADAWTDAAQLADQISHRVSVDIVLLEQGDPGSLSVEKLAALLHQPQGEAHAEV